MCDDIVVSHVIAETISQSLGFTVSLYEYQATIPTLWDTVKGLGSPAVVDLLQLTCGIHSEFIHEHPDLVTPGNAMAFLSDDSGESYNNCHCGFADISSCDIQAHDNIQFGATLKSVISTSGAARHTASSSTS